MTDEKAAITIRFATFNVSMEATNYTTEKPSSAVLERELASGENQQIKNIAEIIQRVRPDVILLNEFDLLPEEKGVGVFKLNYLERSQGEQAPLHYPYQYVSTVNTGVPTPYDLNNDGKKSRYGADAYGFGFFEGQYGMVLLSKYPIQHKQVRTFQYFKWKDMPNYQPVFKPGTKEPWYNAEAWANFRLSSKSHWDIPITVDGQTIHALAMHPTPPAFDGEEDRNGKRNHDEIRLFADYIDATKSAYIYDDKGGKGGLNRENTVLSRFVLMGDFNAADVGDKHRDGVIEQLTESPLVNNSIIPTSRGGDESSGDVFSDRYTAYWGARADYVLPSTFGFKVLEAGVFWPSRESSLFRLVKERKTSSDHRLVWVDLVLQREE